MNIFVLPRKSSVVLGNGDYVDKLGVVSHHSDCHLGRYSAPSSRQYQPCSEAVRPSVGDSWVAPANRSPATFRQAPETDASRSVPLICLATVWRDWKSRTLIMQPSTVLGWHRKGFRLFWTWKIRRGKPGRPRFPKQCGSCPWRIAELRPKSGV